MDENKMAKKKNEKKYEIKENSIFEIRIFLFSYSTPYYFHLTEKPSFLLLPYPSFNHYGVYVGVCVLVFMEIYMEEKFSLTTRRSENWEFT